MENRLDDTPPDLIRNQTLRSVLAHINLVHPIPIVFVLLATISLSFAVDSGASVATRVFLVLSMLGGQLAVGATNEIVDLNLDAATNRLKPLVTGEVAVRSAWVILTSGMVLMVFASLPLGLLALGLCALGNGLGVAYSIWFKRTMYAWLPYALALPLLPIWISVSVDVSIDGLLLLFPIGICAVFSVQIAQALPDVDSDRAAGIDSMTTRLGEEWSLAACWSALLVSALLVEIGRELTSFAAFLPGIVCFAILGNAIAWFVYPSAGVRLAFSIASLSAIALGFAWVAG